MSPESSVRTARILIPIALVLAVVGALTGVWLLVATMVLVLIGQIVSYRLNRVRLRDASAGRGQAAKR